MTNDTNELDCFRRCKAPVTCSKCGRTIPNGSPNFDYNTRDRSTGRYHNDCEMPDGWNAKYSRVEPTDVWMRSGVEFTMKAKRSGTCFTCGKPIIEGITDIAPCIDGLHWRHSYCADTTVNDDAEFKKRELAKERLQDNVRTQRNFGAADTGYKPIVDVDVPEVTSEENETTVESVIATVDVSKMNPITQLIWSEIKPLVETIESRSGDAGKELTRLSELIDDLTNAQAELNAAIAKRPAEVLRIVDAAEMVKCEIADPHPQLKLLMFTAAVCRKHVYLYGPAGSGKSTAAEQVAKALGLDFRFISLNRQSTPSKVEGFISATGTYMSVDFRHCWQNGGVFLIDEMDNASGNLLTSLNSALANGRASFPDGQIDKHDNFICVATGNTTCRGADRMYADRQQLDAATIDRFKFIEWTYDEVCEMKWALAKNPDAAVWVKIVQEIRANVKKSNLRVAVTPRASIDGAEMLAHAKACGFELGANTLLDMTVFKGLDADTIAKIKPSVNSMGKGR